MRTGLAVAWALCSAAESLTKAPQVVSVKASAVFRREKHCKIGRSRPVRRRHKHFRKTLWDAAVPALYPMLALVGRVQPHSRPAVLQYPARLRVGTDHFWLGRIMQLTGAEIVVRCLQEEGVEYVFGYPGGAVLNIYDELFKQEQVKHVLVRHEQGAAHAADGYSRSSHKVGVCLVTSGPGVTK